MRRAQTVFPGILVVSALLMLLCEANLILISVPPPHKNLQKMFTEPVTESVTSTGATDSATATSSMSSFIHDISSTIYPSLNSESGSSTPSSINTGTIASETVSLEHAATGHSSTGTPLEITSPTASSEMTSTLSSIIHDISSTIFSSLISESGTSTPSSTSTGTISTETASLEHAATGHSSTETPLEITSPFSIIHDISSTIFSSLSSESGNSMSSSANTGTTVTSEEPATGHFSTEPPLEITSQTASSDIASTVSSVMHEISSTSFPAANSLFDSSLSSSSGGPSVGPLQETTFPATDGHTAAIETSPPIRVPSSGEASTYFTVSTSASEIRVEVVKPVTPSILPPFRALLSTQKS